MGGYADDNLWLCPPTLFDPALEKLLAGMPHLHGQLAAFVYAFTGKVYLLHRTRRYVSWYLPFSTFDDVTSRNETAPIPHDPAAFYQAAGVEMSDDAEERFRARRKEPESIWQVLHGGASSDSYLNDIGDDGEPVPRALQRLHGPLDGEEIYCRNPEELEYVVVS